MLEVIHRTDIRLKVMSMTQLHIGTGRSIVEGSPQGGGSSYPYLIASNSAPGYSEANSGVFGIWDGYSNVIRTRGLSLEDTKTIVTKSITSPEELVQVG